MDNWSLVIERCVPGSISDETSPEEFLPEIRATVALVALNGDKTVGELAEQFELQPNHTIQFRQHSVETMAGPFAKDWTSKPSGPSEVDLKVLHARIGKLTLGNDFLEGGLKTHFRFFNQERTHQSLARQTLDEVYFA